MLPIIDDFSFVVQEQTEKSSQMIVALVHLNHRMNAWNVLLEDGERYAYGSQHLLQRLVSDTPPLLNRLSAFAAYVYWHPDARFSRLCITHSLNLA